MKAAATFLIALVIATAAQAAEYAIDPVHSSALFKVSHLGASNFYGAMTDITGSVTFDAAEPEASSVDITIKPESVNTFNPARDNHLKGPDFFNAKQFPVMTFKSTKWEKTGDKTYRVTGDFTLRGETKPITVDVTHVGMGKDRRGTELIGFETQFEIDRTEYGMNYGVADTGGLGKNVIVILSVEAGKQ